VSRI
jgi:hypothetical protein